MTLGPKVDGGETAAPEQGSNCCVSGNLSIKRCVLATNSEIVLNYGIMQVSFV